MGYALSLVIVVLLISCDAVDRSKFKTCSQSSFCRRQRHFKPELTPYKVLAKSVTIGSMSLSAKLLDSRYEKQLQLKVYCIHGGIFRVTIEEVDGLRKRYRPLHALTTEPKGEVLANSDFNDATAMLESESGNRLVVTYQPFRIELFSGSRLVMSLNGDGRFNFEQYTVRTADEKKPAKTAPKEPPPQAERSEEDVQSVEQQTPDDHREAKKFDRAGRAVVEDDAGDVNVPVAKEETNLEEGLWTEHYGTHTDTKPYGPSSVGMDVNFIGFEHVYGIPEHADGLALRDTNLTDPYRLYNLDVFEYEVGNTMALYGSVPYMIAHNAERTVGAFWLNSAEGWIDVDLSTKNSSNDVRVAKTHWMFESGVVDLFLLTGPMPADIFRQYSSLTGTSPLWPLFTLGYHVCRWNYMDMADVRGVDANFDLYDIPYDTIWLDIEHTNGKRYFTWDPVRFANPEEMIRNVSAKGRKVVVVIDPHIKKDPEWKLFKVAKEKGFYVKDKDGNDYEGWCWSGASMYLDFLNPAVRNWYADLHTLSEYPGSTEDLFVWNDMNEPAVFSGPEVTMNKDNIHFDGVEHREVHNTFGLFQHSSTYRGLLKRSDGKRRPFVLTRSFFSGSQRYTTVWTGDNTADWSHMKITTPMVLSLGLAGIPVAGADVGGFFRNPDEEMIVRWHQMGAFHPFYRLHSELNTRRREPWVFPDNIREAIRDTIRLRYALLPYWYTVLWQHTMTGLPIVRPLWTEFPDDESTFAEDGEFMLGDALIVMPVVEAGVSSVNMYLPGKNSVWYDWETKVPSHGAGVVQVFTPLEKIPLFIRGGSIVPIRERIRRTSSLTKHDPLTLLIALNKEGTFANGTLYLDDGETFEYQQGKFLLRYFEFSGDQERGKLISESFGSSSSTQGPQFRCDIMIERIIIMGVKYYPREVHSFEGDYSPVPLAFQYDNKNMVLTIRKPSVHVNADFQVDVHF